MTNSNPRLPSSQAYTAEHLNSILSNPLVAKKPRSASFSQRLQPPNVDLKSALEQKLTRLEDKIASATVNLQDVIDCVKSLCGNGLIIPLARRQILKELRPSSKILAWLRGGGQISEEHLLGNKRLAAGLVKLLVLEGRQDMLRSWLVSFGSDNSSLGSWLLCVFGDAECKYGGGLESAMHIFLNAGSEHGLSPRRAIITCILFSTTVVDVKLYDLVAKSALRPEHSNNPAFDAAVLAFCHPAQPSPSEAVEYLKTLSTSSQVDHYFPNKGTRNAHVHLCLRLTRFLLAANMFEDADMVLQFAQQHFAQELDIRPAHPTEIAQKPTKEDFANARLIEGLLAT